MGRGMGIFLCVGGWVGEWVGVGVDGWMGWIHVDRWVRVRVKNVGRFD